VNEERLHQIIRRPHISEKSTVVADSDRQVVFEVASDATKPEVREAVEKLFEVQVDSVQIVNVRGKAKRFGRVAGSRRSWKKAYVRLAEGNDIDFLGSGA
jgi:large subunit ribosomal protein L23